MALLSAYYEDWVRFQEGTNLVDIDNWKILYGDGEFPIVEGSIAGTKELSMVQELTHQGLNKLYDNGSDNYLFTFKAQLTANAHDFSVDEDAVWFEIDAGPDNYADHVWYIGLYKDEVTIYDNTGTHSLGFVPGTTAHTYEVRQTSKGGTLTLAIDGVNKFTGTAVNRTGTARYIYLEIDENGVSSGLDVCHVSYLSVEYYAVSGFNAAKVFTGVIRKPS